MMTLPTIKIKASEIEEGDFIRLPNGKWFYAQEVLTGEKFTVATIEDGLIEYTFFVKRAEVTVFRNWAIDETH